MKTTTRRRPPARPGIGLLLLLAMACLAASACGGSGGDAAAPAPTTAPVAAAATPACTDAAALKASVADLDQLDAPEVGKAGLQAALQDVRARLAALEASAGSRWGGQVAELDGAVGAFQTTVTGLDGDHLLGQLPVIVSNLERVEAAWTTLERQIDQACR